MKNFIINATKIGLKGICLSLAVIAFLGISAKTADAYVFTQTMRFGSTGLEVMQLQRTLNSTNCKVAITGAGSVGFETTYFGVLTNSAVRCFQGSRALGVDGIVGPITRAALSAVGVVNPPNNLPLGCLPGYVYNPLTGKLCVTTPPNDDNNDDGPLQGGTGDISSAVFISNLSNEKVGENENDVEVAGLRIEADDGSDIQLTSVRLNFSQGTADRNFDRYAEEVSIWLDGDKVATVDAEEFKTGDDFDKTINLDGAIIRDGEIDDLVVSISAQSNIDSTDEGETWTVAFDSIRFKDADGAVTTDSTTGDIGGTTRSFTFESFGTAADVGLEIGATNSNPPARSVLADDKKDTNNVLLLAGEFRNEGDSDVEIQELTIRVTPSGSGDASEIASGFTLKIDGTDVETINSNTCQVVGDCDGSGTNTAVDYVFDDINITLDAGSETSFEIRTNLNSISGGVSEGDSLTVSLEADDIVAEDEVGDELGTNELDGTVSGNKQVFYTVSPQITVTNTNISYVGNSNSTANVSFTLSVKALGGTIYLNGDNESNVALKAFQASTLGGNGNTTLSGLVYTPSGNYTVVNNGAEDEYFVINSGNTMNFVLSGSISQTTNTTTAGAEIDSILFGTSATSDATRSQKVMDSKALTDQLETSLLTLIGA